MFGLFDTSQSPALGYMEVVPRWDTATLLPIIKAHTAPGTNVHSDEWEAYMTVHNLPNVASCIVNHSVTFVDPTTGIHTQNVESYWCREKTKLKRMRGCHAYQLQSYWNEFMWRVRYGKLARDALQNLLHNIALQYPV